MGWPGAQPPVRTLPPPRACRSNETGCKVAGLHNSCIHSMASHIAGLKLHHSLNHALCHPEFLPPQYRCGHPKLLQLETPLDAPTNSNSQFSDNNVLCISLYWRLTDRLKDKWRHHHPPPTHTHHYTERHDIARMLHIFYLYVISICQCQTWCHVLMSH